MIFNLEIFMKKIDQLKQWGKSKFVLDTFSISVLNSRQGQNTGMVEKKGSANPRRQVECRNQNAFYHYHSKEILKKNSLGIISVTV